MLLAALASIGFASCGDDDKKSNDDAENNRGEIVENKKDGSLSSLESQAKELCELGCKVDAFQTRFYDGEDVGEELDKAQEELETRLKDLVKIYGPDGSASDEDKKAFDELMNKCDCK